MYFLMNMEFRGDLRDLLIKKQSTCGYDGAAIVKKDGTLLSAYLPTCTNPDVFSIMSATMMGAAETAKSELKINSNLEEINVKAGSKLILAREINKELILILLLSDMQRDNAEQALHAIIKEINDVYTQKL